MKTGIVEFLTDACKESGQQVSQTEMRDQNETQKTACGRGNVFALNNPGIEKKGAKDMKTIHVFALLLIFLSVGCTKPVFDVAAKNKALDNNVFGEGDGQGGNDPRGEGDGDGENDIGENDLSDTDVTFFCSNNKTQDVGYNFQTARSLEIHILDDTGNIICRDQSASIRSTIENDKKLPLSICAAVTDDLYYVRLIDPTRENKIEYTSKGKVKKISNLLNIGKLVKLEKKNGNQEGYAINPRKLDVLYTTKRAEDPRCDRSASPLIIKTEMEDYRGIELTSQDRGVDFDILGENSFPRAHAKKRISWLTKDTYHFLVKPNKLGQVNGINEMFGDNTKGPDGKFSANGYDALAKYDSNGDSIIDSNDRVFRSLALWSDKNLDGIAQKDELVSLKAAGLEAIDLLYDKNYSETDQYGNQTTMKSVVKYSTGDYKLIFDLWFKYQDARSPDIRIPIDRVPRTPNIPRAPARRF